MNFERILLHNSDQNHLITKWKQYSTVGLISSSTVVDKSYHFVIMKKCPCCASSKYTYQRKERWSMLQCSGQTSMSILGNINSKTSSFIHACQLQWQWPNASRDMKKSSTGCSVGDRIYRTDWLSLLWQTKSFITNGFRWIFLCLISTYRELSCSIENKSTIAFPISSVVVLQSQS